MRKILFLRTAWMKNYQGITNLDKPERGGKFIKENGWGGEIYNFKPFKGKMYGYVRLPNGEDKKIKLSRLGEPDGDGYIKNINVVWVATAPEGGIYITGWYKNATVYSEVQHPSTDSNRKYIKETGTGQINYRVVADEKNCRCVPIDERTFKIKGIGHSNVWYAEKEDESFFKNLTEYIEKGISPKKKVKKKWSTDPEKKVKVEKSAIAKTISYYEGLGYEIESVEKENMGWDLTAMLEKRILRLEVKGLSQSEICVQMTPNEYAKMKEHKDTYRICVVTDALKKPKLDIFYYSQDSGEWENDNGNILKIEEIMAAKLSC